MLTTRSTLIRLDELKPERVDGIRKAAQNKLQEVAEAALGRDKRLILRDLLPTDLGLDNNEWTEAAGATDNAWDDTSVAEKSIADNRFVAIIGCRFVELVAAIPISVVKFTVGGALTAMWNLYPLWVPYTIGEGTATGEIAVFKTIAGITESPIIISQNIALTIAEYVLETTTTYKLAFEGFVVEPEGKTLKP